MHKILTRYALGVAALALGFISAPAGATAPCDFLTGGGFIITAANGLHPPANANFGVAGGCKKNGPDAPFWGHLNYVDHGFTPPLHVRSLTITGYREVQTTGMPNNPKKTGTREIYGTATTNFPGFSLVDFCVRVTDNGEPGEDDVFIIWVGFPNSAPVYRTDGPEDHTLGGTGPGGGNIQLHKPNNSNLGTFGGECRLLR
jgi:hypothetical protein